MIAAVKVVLDPGNVLAWLVAGLLAGAIAGRITRGRGYGCIGDIILGLVGAFVGGIVVSPFLHGTHQLHFIGTTVVALLGAVILILVLRLVRRIV
jgi:uncharacterized membrane protein YeaQ/YmgE (transglycosylase-associated protein family)